MISPIFLNVKKILFTNKKNFFGHEEEKDALLKNKEEDPEELPNRMCRMPS
jgi:hypothetical protein